jgi:serine/threonine-protein kinase
VVEAIQEAPTRRSGQRYVSAPIAGDEQELRLLLRKRLLIMALVPSVGLAAWLGLGLLRWHQQWLTDPWSSFTRPPGYGKALIPLSVEIIAVLLLARRSLSVRQLRFVEWLIMVPMAAFFADKDWMNIERVTLEELTWNVGTFANDAALCWVILMIGYGVLIPNTWRRCAAAVGLIGLGSLLISAGALWAKGMPAVPAAQFLGTKTIFLSIAAIIVVYGSRRIQLLNEEVAEARRLGQYQLKQFLGSGGMGEVYLGEHRLLRRPCAIKLIRPEVAGDPHYLLRFEHEVQATATLTHPNTVQIFDYGHTESGTFYYVMEYLPGLTLDELVRRHGPLTFARAVHILRQLCGSLGEAHGIGLIHRDIKPSNVMVCKRGGAHDVVKVLDFGVVAAPPLSADATKPTRRQGNVAGTPSYMSPEQISGRELDTRSDIYSIGCLAYFLLTGQPPFSAPSTVDMAAAHLHQPPPPLMDCGPPVPRKLQAILLRCLAKDPADRFVSAESLEIALAGFPGAAAWTEEEARQWWHSHGSPASPDGNGREQPDSTRA